MFRTYENRDKRGKKCTKKYYNSLIEKLNSMNEFSNLEKIDLAFKDFKIIYPNLMADDYVEMCINLNKNLPFITLEECIDKLKTVYNENVLEEFYNRIVKKFFNNI